MIRLYRAALSANPHMGLGTYWTGSAGFAAEYRLWLDETYGTRHMLYEADFVDLGRHLEIPFGAAVDTSTVDAQALAAAGYDWVSFFDQSPWRGKLFRQYVRLGSEPINVHPLGTSWAHESAKRCETTRSTE